MKVMVPTILKHLQNLRETAKVVLKIAKFLTNRQGGGSILDNPNIYHYLHIQFNLILRDFRAKVHQRIYVTNVDHVCVSVIYSIKSSNATPGSLCKVTIHSLFLEMHFINIEEKSFHWLSSSSIDVQRAAGDDLTM